MKIEAEVGKGCKDEDNHNGDDLLVGRLRLATDGLVDGKGPLPELEGWGPRIASKTCLPLQPEVWFSEIGQNTCRLSIIRPVREPGPFGVCWA